MGRIIRNGIEYGSGNENATNINYDNSLSGLEATTVQEAIDKVSNNLSGINCIYRNNLSSSYNVTNGTTNIEEISLDKGRYIIIGYAIIQNAITASGRNEFGILTQLNGNNVSMRYGGTGQSYPLNIQYPQASIMHYLELEAEAVVIPRLVLSASNILYDYHITVLKVGDSTPNELDTTTNFYEPPIQTGAAGSYEFDIPVNYEILGVTPYCNNGGFYVVNTYITDNKVGVKLISGGGTATNVSVGVKVIVRNK